MKKTQLIVATVSICAFWFSIPAVMEAVGIMANPIDVQNARSGQTYWDELLFMNPENDSVSFDLSAEGPITEWTTFYSKDDLKTPITRLIVPARTNLAAKVKIEIPEKTPNDMYFGKLIGITSTSQEESSSKNLVQIRQKLDRDITITVTNNQIVQFTTIFIPLEYSIDKNKPFVVKVIHENAGNIDIAPNVELRVSKEGKDIFKSIFPYPDGLEPIQPNSRKEIIDQVVWQTKGYDSGEYDISLSACIDNSACQKDEFPISIGYNKNTGLLSLALAKAFSGNMIYIWVIGMGAVLIAVLVGLKSLKNKKQKINLDQV
ncbi:MAG: hypothetical protein WA093_04360 [Minisyncoccales bacterium]